MSTSNKALVPTILLSTVVIGSGIAWWATRSSSNNKTNDASTNVQERVQQAQEQIDTEEVKTRLQRSWSLIQSVVTQLQTIYDRYGRDLLNQLQTVKQESQELVETAKEAGDELQDVAQEQGKEAVEEAQQAKEEARQGFQDNESSSNAHSRGPSNTP